jgi:hypothetical protein
MFNPAVFCLKKLSTDNCAYNRHTRKNEYFILLMNGLSIARIRAAVKIFFSGSMPECPQCGPAKTVKNACRPGSGGGRGLVSATPVMSGEKSSTQ